MRCGRSSGHMSRTATRSATMKPIYLDAVKPLQQTQVQRSEPRPKEASAPPPIARPEDRVSVSSRAEDVGRLVARVNEMGDVRQSRVDAVRALVQSGHYQVSSRTIAGAIMRDESDQAAGGTSGTS